VLDGRNRKSANPTCTNPAGGLQLPRLPERTYGKKQKQKSHSQDEAEEPERYVARPCAERGVEPRERKNGKDRASDFMKKLLQRTPEAPKTALLR
jgi:hypothetical protein